MTRAYVTLLTNEGYLPGALTLGASLKHQHSTKHKLVILLAVQALSDESVALVKEIYDEIIPIDEDLIEAPVAKLVKSLGRKELSVTFSKILLWNQTKYDQLVYIDSDTLPLDNLDHLFEKYEDVESHQIVASADSGWPDIFNSGVLVVKPDQKIFKELVEFSDTPDSTFDGADQGLLNEYFNIRSGGDNWIRLPFLFNVTPNLGHHYQYLPAFNRFFNDIKLLHFFGGTKPWHSSSILTSDTSNYHHLWWAAFNELFSTEKRSHILKHLKGEAHKLKFAHTENVWNLPQNSASASGEVSTVGFSDVDWDEETQTDPLFPWEHRDYVPPSRVFHSSKHFQEPEPEPSSSVNSTARGVSEVKLGSSPSPGSRLVKNYQFSEEGSFNPDKSFDEVSKIPLQFLTKQHEKKNSK